LKFTKLQPVTVHHSSSFKIYGSHPFWRSCSKVSGHPTLTPLPKLDSFFWNLLLRNSLIVWNLFHDGSLTEINFILICVTKPLPGFPYLCSQLHCWPILSVPLDLLGGLLEGKISLIYFTTFKNSNLSFWVPPSCPSFYPSSIHSLFILIANDFSFS